MDLETLHILAKYNARANQDMNDLIANLTATQWMQEFGAYFGSIHSVCNHLYIADFAWLKRFAALRGFRYSQTALFEQTFGLDSLAFKTIEDYLDKRIELDEQLKNFATEVSTDDLRRPLTYKNFKGIEFTKNFGGLILHLFNHQTHHRGMISVYLERLGVENDFSGLLSILS